MRRAAAPIASILVALALAAPARANGRYPQAGQIVASPADPAHLLVRTTFGMLDSRDAGATWGWVCEEAVGFQGVEDPPVAITSADRVVAGLSNGLVATTDHGCTWERPAGELAMQRVLDVAMQAGDPSHAVAATASYTPKKAFLVWTTDDGGATWTRAPAALPAEVTYVATIDVAPSDPKRLWASGSAGSPTDGVLLRSDDGGASWTSIPLGVGTNVPYVAGVDPARPDRVWVRVDGGGDDRLLLTDDAGAHVTEVFATHGWSLLGFALSPDGAKVAIGGPSSTGGTPGVLVSSGQGTPSFAPAASVGVRCLAWTAGGLLSCNDAKYAGFTVGRSTDDGATFAPLLALADLAPLACPGGTPAASLCPAAWPGVAQQLGLDAGAPPPVDGGDDAPSDAPPPFDAGADAAPGAAPPSSTPPPSDDAGSSGCATSRGGAPLAGALLVALAALLAAARRPR